MQYMYGTHQNLQLQFDHKLVDNLSEGKLSL